MLVTSSMLSLGSQAPNFELIDTITNEKKSLTDLKSDVATVVMFICNHCPYVKHINPELVRLATDYQPKNVSFIAISANDITTHPDDAPDKMQQVAREQGYPFPYLYDETQETAHAYKAECTPDFYLFDADLKCVYRGRLDDSTPGNNVPLTGEDLRRAIDALLSSESINPDQKPSQGCSIKWKD